MKVITLRDTPPYGHAPTYQISLTYLERQKSYDPDKLRWEEAEEAEEAEEKIRLKQYVCLRSKGRHNNEFHYCLYSDKMQQKSFLRDYLFILLKITIPYKIWNFCSVKMKCDINWGSVYITWYIMLLWWIMLLYTSDNFLPQSL